MSEAVAQAAAFAVSDRQPNPWLGRVLFLACAFPYVGPPGVNFDVQPWAFLVALVILALAAATHRLVFHRDMLLLLAAGVAFAAVSALDLSADRALRVTNVGSAGRLLFGVAALPIIAATVYALKYRVEERLFIAVYVIWMVVAVIQLGVPSFGGAFLPRVSTSVTRGVVALAPEPDMYGRAVIALTVIAFLLHLAGQLRRRTLTFLVVCSVFQVLFLSRAMTSAGFMMVVGGSILYVASGRAITRFTMVLGFSVVVGVAVWAGMRLMAQARVFMLLRALAENPEVWTQQGGFVLRAFNPFLSLQVGLVETLGRGVGVASTPTPGQSVVLWPFGFRMELADRAHGGLVGLVYNAGLVGFLYVAAFYYALVRALRRLIGPRQWQSVLAGVVIFSVVLFFDQSVANGMHAYAFGLLLLLSRTASADRRPAEATP